MIFGIQVHTTEFDPQVVSVEELKCLDGLEVVHVILGHLRYFEKTKLILVLYERTTLRP